MMQAVPSSPPVTLQVQPGQSLKWNAGQYLSARHRQIFEQYSSIYDMFIVSSASTRACVCVCVCVCI